MTGGGWALHPVDCTACGGLSDDATHRYTTETDEDDASAGLRALEARAAALVEQALAPSADYFFGLSNAASPPPDTTIEQVLAAAAELDAVKARFGDAPTHLAASSFTIQALRARLPDVKRSLMLEGLALICDPMVPDGQISPRTGPVPGPHPWRDLAALIPLPVFKEPEAETFRLGELDVRIGAYGLPSWKTIALSLYDEDRPPIRWPRAAVQPWRRGEPYSRADRNRVARGERLRNVVTIQRATRRSKP